MAEALKNSTSKPGVPPVSPATGDLQPVAAPDLLRSLSFGLSAQYLQYKREEGIDLNIGEVPPLPQERIESIYSPEPIGTSPEGYPVYLYQERILAEPRFVVRLPNGKAVYSDRQGKINPIPDGDSIVTTAILAGFGGIFLAGTFGGLAGAAAGAVATRLWLNRRNSLNGSTH